MIEVPTRLLNLFKNSVEQFKGDRGTLEIYCAYQDSCGGLLTPHRLRPVSESEERPRPQVFFTCYDSRDRDIFEAFASSELENESISIIESLLPQLPYLKIEWNAKTDATSVLSKTLLDLKTEFESEVQVALAQKKNLPRNRKPYGYALSEKVANALLAGKQLKYSHREYSGTGLLFHDGVFDYAEFWDGHPKKIINSFSGQVEFTDWLAKQTDEAFSRIDNPDHFYWDNQTITEARLIEFAFEKNLGYE